MKQTQPKSSPTDEHASRIARAIGKGLSPPITDALERYCESAPREMFAAFSGAARHMPPAGNDETLSIGYLFVLQGLLEHVRYRAERGYADAAGLIAEFQAHVAALAEAGELDRRMLVMVGGTLHQAKIPAAPEFAAAFAAYAGEELDGPVPPDIRTAIEGIIEACEADPFMAVESLLEAGHAMPADTRSALASALALAGLAAGRTSAVLLLLDRDPAVRRAAAGSLSQVAGRLAPADVRRLIAMRNWRPENERAEVDALIRKARAAGVECAQWESGSAELITASGIDGSGAQGVVLVSPAGRKKKRLSSILTKAGIAEAFSAEPESRRSIENAFRELTAGGPLMAVSRGYLDLMVGHALALAIEKGLAPPPGLLQVAETIGGADWQPARIAVDKTLAELMGQIPKRMREPAAIAAVLRRSGDMLGAVAQSWFEDDPHIAGVMERAQGRNRKKLAAYLLQSVMGQYRARWTDIVLRTTLWMREGPAELELPWRELALVAQALANGRDVSEIGLMRDIALRTITVLRDVRREEAADEAPFGGWSGDDNEIPF
jgi:hypothetical protein